MANIEDRLTLTGESGKEYELKYTVQSILKIEKFLPGNNIYKYVNNLFNIGNVTEVVVMSFADMILFFRYHNPTVKYKTEEDAGDDLQDVMNHNDIFVVQATILAALSASGIFGKTSAVAKQEKSESPNQ